MNLTRPNTIPAQDHVHSQEQPKATGQSHWAMLRMAHRTATKFKAPSNADTAKKVSPTGIQFSDLPYLYQQITNLNDNPHPPQDHLACGLSVCL